MPRKSAAQRQEKEQAEFPATLIPPGEAADKDRSAYWIGLLSNIDDLKAATETTDFFVLMQEFPGAVWDRLAIYLYRLPDDSGMLIKNSDEKPHYIKVLRQPLTEEFVSKNWGGGKYQAYLKIDNKEVLRKHTFRIDGDPKMQPGQRVEIEGKAVSIGGAAAAPAESRSDLASVIEASSSANKQNMEILAEGSKAAIALVREQATAATKPDAQAGLMDKLVTVMIERMMNPPIPPDPLETFLKLQTIMQKNPAAEAPEPKDPPITEAMDLVEKFTGRSFSELMRGKSAPAPEATPPWLAIALGVAEKFFAVAPTLFQQATYAKSLEFQRAVWLRSAQPGAQPPKELLAENAPAPSQPGAPSQQQPQPAQQPTPDQLNAAQLAEHIVQMVRHGFESNPYDGQETAAAIAFNFGRQIEATGLDAFLSDEKQIKNMVAGNPILQPLSAHAKWPQFEAEFIEYMALRFGVAEAEVSEVAGPQPVA